MQNKEKLSAIETLHKSCQPGNIKHIKIIFTEQNELKYSYKQVTIQLIYNMIYSLKLNKMNKKCLHPFIA